MDATKTSEPAATPTAKKIEAGLGPVSRKVDAEVEIYQYMVLKPLELVADLVRGEHHQAAGVALDKLFKDASEFSLRLSRLSEELTAKPAPAAEEKKPEETPPKA